jgi:hypothetical protein
MNKENLQPTKKTTAKSKFAPINTVLPSVIAKLGLDRRMQEQALFSLWPSLLDPIYASRSMPLYIDGQGILVVAAQNGSTAQELSFLKAKLLVQLQPIGTELGLTIKGMRFDLKRFSRADNGEGHSEPFKNEPVDKTAPAAAELAAFTLSEAELNEIAGLKEKLEVILGVLHLEAGSDSQFNQLAGRIAYLVEKKLRLKKWYVQENMPVCEQCGEPLSQSCRELNITLCPCCGMK